MIGNSTTFNNGKKNVPFFSAITFIKVSNIIYEQATTTEPQTYNYTYSAYGEVNKEM